MTNDTTRGTSTLPIILLAAVLQGWTLYGLHVAIKGSHWPATAPGWLLALYAVAIFVPLTMQLLAEHVRQRALWIIVAALGLLFGYFGWHHGAAVIDAETLQRVDVSGDWFSLALLLTLLWLLILPFIQARLGSGDWQPRYQALFTHAWRNKVTLAEAALFTVLFWLLLVLWGQLFDMLGIGFFEDLFEEPIFIYPVTALSFGIALHLIGSVERLTSAVLEQVLNVLKWLAIVAGLILTLFTLALLLKLPGMIGSGQRAISASWLLWLVAVTVLLLNAAYRDGSVAQPYPRAIGLALRFIAPLTIVIAGTALYSMYVRVETFGFTTARVWGMIVAAAACIYSIGYSVAARRSDGWMASMARINVGAALFLIVALSLALTPLLSPYRIAAGSQFRLALSQEPAAFAFNRQESPLIYLRFKAGRYGVAKLDELTQVQDHPRAEIIRKDALAARQQKQWWSERLPSSINPYLDKMQLAAGRTLTAPLRSTLETDLKDLQIFQLGHTEPPATGGVFVDLNRDGQEEFVLVAGRQIFAYTGTDATGWRRAGTLIPYVFMDPNGVLNRILAGDLQVREPQWQELQVGHTLLRMNNP